MTASLQGDSRTHPSACSRGQPRSADRSHSGPTKNPHIRGRHHRRHGVHPPDGVGRQSTCRLNKLRNIYQPRSCRDTGNGKRLQRARSSASMGATCPSVLSLEPSILNSLPQATDARILDPGQALQFAPGHDPSITSTPTLRAASANCPSSDASGSARRWASSRYAASYTVRR